MFLTSATRPHKLGGVLCAGFVCALLLLGDGGGVCRADDETQKAVPRKTKSQKAVPQMGYAELMDYVIEHNGAVVLVNFWATWCGPCLKEMPSLVQLREEVDKKRLEIVGVSLDYDPRAVAAYLEANELNFPTYIASSDLMELLQIRSIPKMLLYDVGGMEVVNCEGYVPLERLRPTIEEHLPPASE